MANIADEIRRTTETNLEQHLATFLRSYIRGRFIDGSAEFPKDTIGILSRQIWYSILDGLRDEDVTAWYLMLGRPLTEKKEKRTTPDEDKDDEETNLDEESPVEETREVPELSEAQVAAALAIRRDVLDIFDGVAVVSLVKKGARKMVGFDSRCWGSELTLEPHPVPAAQAVGRKPPVAHGERPQAGARCGRGVGQRAAYGGSESVGRGEAEDGGGGCLSDGPAHRANNDLAFQANIVSVFIKNRSVSDALPEMGHDDRTVRSATVSTGGGPRC